MIYNTVALVFILYMLKTSTSVPDVEDEDPVEDAMKKHKVVPNVIPTAPPLLLNVTYPPDVEVTLGNELTPNQVKYEPIVKWFSHPVAFYTLAMIDPDTPSAELPLMAQWQHWLVGNIPDDEIYKGDILAEYISPFPSNYTELHRYIFLIYHQPQKLVFNEDRLKKGFMFGRANFNITKFAEKYNLGDPLAGNFFLAKYDDYVPILSGQLR